MKLTIKLLLIITLAATVSLKNTQNKEVVEERKQNQIEVFANQYEAPTNSTQLGVANYSSPLMSHVLFEEDPKRKLRKHEFTTSVRFNSYRLTKGETEQIFSFTDGNRDDLVDQSEWDTFSALYILPFEACDKNRDYLLDEAEFKECFDKDPRTAFIVFRRRDFEDRHSKLMWAITSRAAPLINFHEYLFMRRALFSWKNCHSNSKYISKSAFKCAMRVAILTKVNFKMELESIYDIGIENSNSKSLIELDFLNYLRILHSTYYFTVFGEPMSIPYIEKTSFIKAIREDRLPNNYEEKEINYLYELTNTNTLIPNNQMTFGSFTYFHNLKRLFNRYSVERPMQLTKTDFLKLLTDVYTPYKVVHAIDAARSDFNETVYMEASLILKRKRPNEGRYFFNFKQDASANTASIFNETTVNNTYYNVTRNDTSREVFFSTFRDINKETLTKENFYRAFQLGNLFTSFVPDSRFLVSPTAFVDKLMEQYSLVTPPVSFNLRKSYTLYKQLPREVHVDILLFSAIENFRNKFESALKTSNAVVYESYAKVVLQDFGMRLMPDPVIDLAKKGYDNLRRRTYDTEELIKFCMIVQSVAAENVRAKEMMITHDIKTTSEVSRRFPGWERRHQASPYV